MIKLFYQNRERMKSKLVYGYIGEHSSIIPIESSVKNLIDLRI